jgi:hypothetical protein
MMEARQVWRSALAQMGDTEGEAQEFMSDRVVRLEAMLSQSGAISQEGTE